MMKRWMWIIPLWGILIILTIHLFRVIIYQIQFNEYITVVVENNEHLQYMEEHFTMDEAIDLMFTFRDRQSLMESALKEDLGPGYFWTLNEYLEKQLDDGIAWWSIDSPYFPMATFQEARKSEVNKYRK